MDTRRTTMVFDVDYTRDGFSRQRRSGTGIRYRYNGPASTRAPRDRPRPGKEQRPTLVSQIQAWLATWAPGTAASDAWNHLPALLDAAIERGIVSADFQRADREDLKQRVWLRIVSRFKRLDPATELSSLVAWAEKIARRETIRESERRKRRSRRESTDQSGGLESIVETFHIDEANRERVARLVVQTINDLEADGLMLSAKILTLHDLENRPLREVALRVGVSLAQLRRRRQQALEHFRVRFAVRARHAEE